MKDCCKADAPRSKFKRTLNTITTVIIIAAFLGGLLLVIFK
jgi:hypothetical protein